ncbi:MAG: pyridoxamine 5'-phosphate oxidase family protein [Candidatus Thorarchaeota archaeon]
MKTLANFSNILDKKAFINVALVKKNGRPHVTPLWYDLSEEDKKNNIININTATGRIKSILNEGSNVAACISDPDNSYKYVGFEGKIISRIEGDEANKHIDSLAKRYLDKDRYPYHQPNQQRIKLRIKVEKIYAN